MRINFRLIFNISIVLIHSTNIFAENPDGYTDSLETYSWFENNSEMEFIDSNGIIWYKVSEIRSDWDEAVLIREANIYALILLGFDSAAISKDITLYKENSILFTKLSRLENYKHYTNDWELAFNTDNFKKTARKSEALRNDTMNTRLVLKFYDQKAKIENVQAIGLVKKRFCSHSFEAGMEIFELIFKKIVGNKNPNADPIYDMHLRNSEKLIKFIR